MVSKSLAGGIVGVSLRKAFTLIELIFAIVIIGVVVLTIPTMIQVNNKAQEGSAAQEAIFLVSAVLSETTTLLWDQNSLGGTATDVELSRILDVNAPGNAAYNRVDANSTLRVGNLREDLHRHMFDNVFTPAQTVKQLVSQPLTNTVANAVGYKNAYTVVATRDYVDDTPNNPYIFSIPPNVAVNTAVNPTNVKITEVQINATIDGVNQVIARLRAYTCNIGEVDYAKRRL